MNRGFGDEQTPTGPSRRWPGAFRWAPKGVWTCPTTYRSAISRTHRAPAWPRAFGRGPQHRWRAGQRTSTAANQAFTKKRGGIRSAKLPGRRDRLLVTNRETTRLSVSGEIRRGETAGRPTDGPGAARRPDARRNQGFRRQAPPRSEEAYPCDPAEPRPQGQGAPRASIRRSPSASGSWPVTLSLKWP